MSKQVPAAAEINPVETAKDIFEGLNPDPGASIVLVHVKPGGNDDGDGSSWSTAKGTVQAALDAVARESANNVHLILLASGTYRPAAPLAMKNHVAIIGGFFASTDDGVGYYRGGATEITGNGKIRVFNNQDLDKPKASTAVLARLTVTGGNAADGGGMSNSSSSPTVTHVSFSGNTATNGGGMSNNSSSPILTHVNFSGNSAASWGGGMYNNGSSPMVTHATFSENSATSGGGMLNISSSPTVTHVSFSGNIATSGGGGMYNFNSSSPTVTHVTFSGNTATTNGGGMVNSSSSPTVTHVTFSGNTATTNGAGGGMYNDSSSPILTHATFSGNTATNGGGMYNQDSGPKIASSIFWESAFYNENNPGNTAAPLVAHSMVQGGYTGGTAIITPTMSPFSGALGDNGGFVETIPIGSDSEAKDSGLYVARKGTTSYYSTDNSTWYTTPKASGTAATLPADAERYDFDARGYSHNGRPDMGAYEHGGTAP